MDFELYYPAIIKELRPGEDPLPILEDFIARASVYSLNNFLRRLHFECVAYLKTAIRVPSVMLWAGSWEGQVKCMGKLYESFPADGRPGWIDMDEITRLAEKVKAKPPYGAPRGPVGELHAPGQRNKSDLQQ